MIISLVIFLVSLYNEENNEFGFLAYQLSLSAEMCGDIYTETVTTEVLRKALYTAVLVEILHLTLR